MALIPQVTCRRCHRSYSALRGKCPFCGTRNIKESTRPTVSTDAAVKGTRENAKAKADSKFQMIFGGVVLVAIIVAVIALISVSLGDRIERDSVESAPPLDSFSPTDDDIQYDPIVPDNTAPEPDEIPTPEVSSIEITFLGTSKEEFSMKIGDKIQLDASAYPITVDVEFTWRSSNEDICTVDSTGLVTGVGSGWATVYAEVGNVSQACDVLVW